MIYPDFAFYTSTQIVLFFINCLTTTASYYWGANIILQIYQKKVSFKQKLLFSLVSAMLLHILVAYGLAYVNGIIQNQNRTFFLGSLINLIDNMLPFSYLVLYLLGVNILKLSSYTSIKIMQLSYVYFVCSMLVLRIVGNIFFPITQDPIRWNYLRDIGMLVSGTAVIFIFYKLVLYLVNRYKLYIDFSDNIIVGNIKHELGKNFFLCFIIYSLIFISTYFFTTNNFYWVLILIIMAGYLVLRICRDYIKIYKGNLINRDEHITSLHQSIEEFRGIRHDFNNILQTYSGYLVIEDYTKLKLYHEKITNTIVSAGTHMDLSQRIWENPSFFSLIINKSKEAQKKYIVFRQNLSCNMEELYIDELDFSRIMAVLLDNAIEEAQQTPLKRINFSGQTKPDGSKLFILSNDTLNEVSVENFFTPGFTTKEGHTGQGLIHLRNILHNYGNTLFNISYYKGSTTVYLELKPIPIHSKP